MDDMRKLMEALNRIDESDGPVPRTATQINLGDLRGLDLNRLVRQLEKLGLEQTKDFYIQSGRASWILNQAYSHEVDGVLSSFGIGEQLDEVEGYKVGEPHPTAVDPYKDTLLEVYGLFDQYADSRKAPVEYDNAEASAWAAGVGWAAGQIEIRLEKLKGK